MKTPAWLKSKDAQAIEEYDLGLAAKYAGDWTASLIHNKRANELRAGDEATIWNLGIAATALGDWDEARKAWVAYGITVNDGPGEVLMPEVTGCVRLNPNDGGEVVWGTRIDPARMLVANVPLPESGRRCGDIVLHDGAPDGYRRWNNVEFPVFNELAVWRESDYSTFEVDLLLPNEPALDGLVAKCRRSQLGIEDWSSIRITCAACSRGTPGDHECTTPKSGQSRYGMAAKSEKGLREVLDTWVEVTEGAAYGRVELVVAGAGLLA